MEVQIMIYKNEVQNPEQSPALIFSYITAQMNFIFRARMLWRDLATWLRSYKVSLYGGVGNTDEISQRLFRVPLEYGNILKVFFGDQATEQLINLLTQYIAILQSLFIAQYNNDINEINNLTQQAYQNVKTTAALLASVNPYWTQSEWVTLLTLFTDLQIQESTTFLTEDYAKNNDIFDRILSFTNIMGDYFSEGIINHFILRQQQQLQAT
jgi:hypothetical protein